MSTNTLNEELRSESFLNQSIKAINDQQEAAHCEWLRQVRNLEEKLDALKKPSEKNK